MVKAVSSYLGFVQRNNSNVIWQYDLIFILKSDFHTTDSCLTVGDLSCARKLEAMIVLP